MSNLELCTAFKHFLKQNVEEETRFELNIPELLLIQQQSDLIAELVKNQTIPRKSKSTLIIDLDVSISTA